MRKLISVFALFLFFFSGIKDLFVLINMLMKCSNGFASGFEGGSDNYRLLHAWDDRL